MRKVFVLRAALLSSAAVSAVVAASSAYAGGLAIREQSAYYQGMSFAGDAAGGSLSSMFWNPAATATMPGLNTESSYTLIVPDAQVTVTKTTPGPLPFPDSSDIANLAALSASYASYQLSGYSPNLFIGVGLNSPFGNSFEPDRENYKGAIIGRTSKLLSFNLNPTVAYRIAPGVTIGAGVQIQYVDATLKFAFLSPLGPNVAFHGDDVAFGATAGILLQPSAGTSIGLGWRSQLSHTLDGEFGIVGVIPKQNAEGQINLPDIVTLSMSQALAPNMRLLGTVEWSNWSRLKQLTVTPTAGPGLAVPLNWSDGWFFALGGEYDWSRQLTLRTGVAYEISPVDSPEKRTISIPDSNRVWVSGGASYKWTESTTIDLAYTHIFFDDARFDRTAPLTGIQVEGTTTASTDIISVGLKTRWGGGEPLK
jgi:long-chain fatty acid transport protein